MKSHELKRSLRQTWGDYKERKEYVIVENTTRYQKGMINITGYSRTATLWMVMWTR